MLELPENNVKTIFFFFNFVILAICLKIMTKKCHKSDFLAKTHLFGQNFQKYCLIQHLRKKKVPRAVS